MVVGLLKRLYVIPEYMDEILTEEHGMPNLIRTEETYRSGGRGRPSHNMQKKAKSIQQQIKDNI